MPFRCLTTVVVVSLGTSPSSVVRADSFTVEAWDLGVSAYHAYPDMAGASITTLINPLIDNHQVQLPSDPRTTCAAQYQMSWTTSYGSFRIDAQEAAFGQASGTVRTGASGSISITPSADLSLWVHGSYSYDLQGQMTSSFDVAVDEPISGTILWSQLQQYDTVWGPPYSGTFYVDADVVLPAGTTWVMFYAMATYAWEGSANLTGTGNGSLTFEITPEPATLALLLLAAHALGRFTRRRRRR